ncbi:MAG: sulfite exporter TauE/SafE family protein [Thermoplasmatales archaeon]|nr:MAG: sulfite exporter TauE/SafE family protein [Thermoplasmatales archaeon]
MKSGNILLSVVFIFVIISSIIIPFAKADEDDLTPAIAFSAMDENGVNFSLSDYRGDVILIHFTGLETPLCIECLEEMEGQIKELEKLSNSDINATIITINIRKNPYSDSGMQMAERDFKANISWHWVEDYSPYPIAALYQNYWTVDGAFSNPTLVLINQDFNLVGVYNVYCLGKGSIDGIQTFESLSKDVSDIISGNWEGFKGGGYSESITFLGIFILGILTAATPCSIALLVAMISYVGALQKKSEKKTKKLSIQGFWIGIIFTIGMSFVFFIFGMVISSLGIFLEVSTLFYLIAGIILIILGINIFKPITELLKIKEKSETDPKIMDKGRNLFIKISKKSIYIGAFFLGILFSIGWAPCAISLMMPVFILILAQEIPILTGGLLLFVFGLGHGIPIIPLCAVTSSVRGKIGNKYVNAGKWMQRIFGVIIVVIGLIMAARFWGINLW